MAKLYFRYGCMGSSKTARLCMDAKDYQLRGEFVLPMKPVIDTRSKRGVIESRTGLSVKCLDVYKDYSIYNHVSMLLNNGVSIACIFIDEALLMISLQIFMWKKRFWI